MSSKLYDIVATVGKYTGNDGSEKKRYLKIGSLFRSDDGKMSIKLDAVPVGPEWSGWAALYEPREGSDHQQRQAPTREVPMSKRSTPPPPPVERTDEMDEIPF